MKVSRIILFLLGILGAQSISAHSAPSFHIDTAGFTLSINGKKVNPYQLDSVLIPMIHSPRKVVKANKTLFIFDEYGIVVEQDARGIAIRLFMSAGSGESEPAAAYTGSVSLNSLTLGAQTGLAEINRQLPKTEKTMVSADMLFYLHPRLVMTGSVKNGAVNELGFAFVKK